MNQLKKENNDYYCSAPCEVLHSIALEEAALSHILNAEGEKIQKAVATSNVSIDDLLCINNSVTKTIREVTSLELVLLSKLEAACSYCCRPTPPVPPTPTPPTPIVKCITIRGQVTDRCNRPLSNACILAKGLNQIKVCTDQCGYYQICQLPVLDSFSITPLCHYCCAKEKHIHCINQACYTINFQL